MSKMYEALKRAQEQGLPLEIAESVVVEPIVAQPIATPQSAIYEPPLPYPDLADHEDPVTAAPTGAFEDARSVDGLRQLPIREVGRAAVIPWNASDSPGGEQYRIIRTRIVQHPERPKVIVMSSAGSGDGKTVSAINVAGVLSLRDNANVLLIDADFRRAGVSAALGLPPGPGLANVLGRSCALQDALIRVDQFPNLYVLTAGTGGGNPAELLDSDQWKALCASVREHFDFVMIDAPPIAALADYELIQAVCDGVIFVVRPDHSDRTLVNKAFQMIPARQRLGVIVNCTSKWFLWKTHESYHYAAGKQ